VMGAANMAFRVLLSQICEFSVLKRLNDLFVDDFVPQQSQMYPLAYLHWFIILGLMLGVILGFLLF